MARAWSGPRNHLVLDPDARSTLGNAVNAAATARELDAEEVVLVTSPWHGRRAVALFRAALWRSGIRLRLEPCAGVEPGRARMRERACRMLVPVQAALASLRFDGL